MRTRAGWMDAERRSVQENKGKKREKRVGQY